MDIRKSRPLYNTERKALAGIDMGILKISACKVCRVVMSILIFAVFFMPFYWMVLTSVKSLSETLTFPPTFFAERINFENFTKALSSGPFLQYTKLLLLLKRLNSYYHFPLPYSLSYVLIKLIKMPCT